MGMYDNHLQAARNWKAANPDKVAAQALKWKAKNPLKAKLMAALRRARKMGKLVTIGLPYLNTLPEVQTGKCALSGIPFRLDGYSPFSPSIDRIDNSKGYQTGNVRIILLGLNSLKGVGTDEDMWLIIETMGEIRANSRG